MENIGEVYGFGVTKGGVGKSTFANNLTYEFAEQGYKTVLVDFDPQSTQTNAFMKLKGYKAFTGSHESNICNLFSGKIVKPISIETVKHVDNPEKHNFGESHFIEEAMTIDFIPSNKELTKLVECDEIKREKKMELIIDFIKDLRNKYDKVIIDCPPSLGIITTSVLRVSNSILIPIPTKNVDTDGMAGFFEDLDDIYNEYSDINIKKIVVVPNMYNSKESDSKYSLQTIKLVPNIMKVSENLSSIKCVVGEYFPQRSCVQIAPSYENFLAPYVMRFERSKKELLLKINSYAKLLEN